MARCAYCRTLILFGGKQVGPFRYCDAACLAKGAVLRLASQLPEETVEQALLAIHSGECPRCHGLGPVDVHMSYRVWSALLVTGWSSRPHVCCSFCGWKAKLGDTAFSLVLGWWGFPWGLILTPVQVCRNLIGLATGPDSTRPSDRLRNIVRAQLAAQLLQQQPLEAQASPPPSVHPPSK